MTKPFPHWFWSRPVAWGCLAAARDSIPPANHRSWIRYDNELEKRKWTMEDGLPPAWTELLSRLSSRDALDAVSELTGIRNLQPSRRGGGLHVMFPGGWLAPHLDYALHPSGLERRVNLILFLDSSDREHGGGLQLCDPMGAAVKTLYPKAGEAVVWECGEETYHAVEPLADDSPPRVTAAVYYLAKPRPGCVRRRALFLPRR